MKKKWLETATVAAVSAGTAALTGAYYAYWEAFKRDPKRQADPHEIPDIGQFGYYKAIILVPTVTLVEQWEKECRKFHHTPIPFPVFPSCRQCCIHRRREPGGNKQR